MKSNLKCWTKPVAIFSAAASLLLTSEARAATEYADSSEYYYVSEGMSVDEILREVQENENEVAVGNEKRRVPPEKFHEYQIVVDVFRMSKKRPVLGTYFPEYLDVTTSTFKEQDPKKREALARKRFDRLAGFEFAVVSVDGIPQRAYLISGAVDGTIQQQVKARSADGTRVFPVYVDGVPLKVESKKSTPSGNFMLSTYYGSVASKDEQGKKVTLTQVPNPFRISATHDRSSMWYGLQVTDDGILIHATPHYYQLGKPASMGCIRQSTPDAMWLWDLVTNKSEGRQAMIRIHPRGSAEAVERLREMIYDPNFVAPALQVPEVPKVYANQNAARGMVWLVDEINLSYQRIRDYIEKTGNGDYSGIGHDWWNPRTKSYEIVEFPRCGNHDCSIWGDPRETVRKLRAADWEAHLEARRKDIAEGRPILRSDSIALKMPVGPLPVKSSVEKDAVVPAH
jgi:lipoprotein-anchoring transpeptidase ErfK/SrfK